MGLIPDREDPLVEKWHHLQYSAWRILCTHRLWTCAHRAWRVKHDWWLTHIQLWIKNGAHEEIQWRDWRKTMSQQFHSPRSRISFSGWPSVRLLSKFFSLFKNLATVPHLFLLPCSASHFFLCLSLLIWLPSTSF